MQAFPGRNFQEKFAGDFVDRYCFPDKSRHSTAFPLLPALNKTLYLELPHRFCNLQVGKAKKYTTNSLNECQQTPNCRLLCMFK